jgi:hypothetical protein
MCKKFNIINFQTEISGKKTIVNLKDFLFFSEILLIDCLKVFIKFLISNPHSSRWPYTHTHACSTNALLGFKLSLSIWQKSRNICGTDTLNWKLSQSTSPVAIWVILFLIPNWYLIVQPSVGDTVCRHYLMTLYKEGNLKCLGKQDNKQHFFKVSA